MVFRRVFAPSGETKEGRYNGPGRWRSVRRSTGLLLAIVLALSAAGCTQPPRSPVATPDAPVWFAGDSIAHVTAIYMNPEPFVSGVGGAGFTSHAAIQITAFAEEKLDLHGVTPELMLVLGSVNDLAHGATLQETIDGFIAFEAAMQARGIPVLPVLSPWDAVTAIDDFNQWLVTNHPDSIDCLDSVGPMPDRVHPGSYGAFAACISASLPS